MKQIEKPPIEYIRCSTCGKKVSTTFKPHNEFVLRAYIECPECVEKSCKALRAEVLREVQDVIYEFLKLESPIILNHLHNDYKWKALKHGELPKE